MPGWTADRITQLAPDVASAKAGQGLAATRQWVSLAFDGDTLWGECQGSGAKPYQVRIDLAEPAFKCSCPSRKFPCKHALGLMLLFAAGNVATAVKPAWVQDWLSERAARAEKKKEKADAPPKPIDVESQSKRREQRLARVADGLDGLKRWIDDLVRAGIASAPSRGYDFFDEQARRLIDAQSPGAARRVQQVAGVAASGAIWQRPFLEQLGLLHLLIRGFARRDTLPGSARDVIDNALGLPCPQEHVLALPGVADRWQVVAQEVTIEASLRTQHTWLFGQRTRSIGQILSFAFGDRPFDASLPPGFAFDGEISFFPGDGLRALVKVRDNLMPLEAFDGLDDSRHCSIGTRRTRATNPWMEGLAAPLRSLTPRRVGDAWSLVDTRSRVLPVTVAEADGWSMLAISGGAPIDSVVHYDGRRARPLAVVADGQVVRLGRTEVGAA